MQRCLVALAVAVALVACLPACGGGDHDDDGLTIVASFFPLAELARAVAPDATVHDLMPAGVEPHDHEPGARDIDRIEDADLVLYLGGGFQPAVERAARRARKKLDLADGAEDPHVWLDPSRMTAMLDRVAGALGRPVPRELEAQLADLDNSYRTRLAGCRTRTLVTTHDAFGHLARRYDLDQQSLTGRTPDAEPDPKRVAQLLDLIKARGVTTVFTEGTDEAKSAEALAREAGVKTAVLRTLEQPVAGGYVAGMRANLDALAQGLQC